MKCKRMVTYNIKDQATAMSGYYRDIQDLLEAVENDNTDIVARIFEYGNVELLLKWRDPVSKYNLLHKAAESGAFGVTEFLCDEHNIPIGEHDVESRTAIHIACKQLHGEDYSQNKDYDDWFYYSETNHYKIAEYLVARAVKTYNATDSTHPLNKKESNGLSILQMAYEYDLPELSQIARQGLEPAYDSDQEHTN